MRERESVCVCAKERISKYEKDSQCYSMNLLSRNHHIRQFDWRQVGVKK